MGDMEMIFRDGSGIHFGENGATHTEYHVCDFCNQMQPEIGGMDVTTHGLALLWMCKGCKEKLR